MLNQINTAILIVAVLLLLFGFLLLVRGLFQRAARQELYDVGKQKARRTGNRAMVQGLAILAMGALMVLLWRVFDHNPLLEAETASTELVSQELAPTSEMVLIEETAEVIPTPTSPPPTETPIPPTMTPTETPTPTPTMTPTPYVIEGVEFVTVDAELGLFLRTEPEGDIIFMMDDGLELKLLDGVFVGEEHVWQEVQTLDETTGWIANDFVALPDGYPAPTSEETPTP